MAGWLKAKADTGSNGKQIGKHRAAAHKPSTMEAISEIHKGRKAVPIRKRGK